MISQITQWWREALGPGRTPSDDQIDAIIAPHTGRRSVDAGAGTGKTSTLALRALYLIESESVRADQIVVITFTKKAAAEIGSRIADTLDRAIANGARFENDGRGVRCTTIHALAADIRREFAFDLGFAAPPTAVSDGEAHAIFNGAFRALLEGDLDVDTSCFPFAEIDLRHLERDLGKLALRLKNHGKSPDEFETEALAETKRFGEQKWGQLFKPGKTKAKPRVACEPDNAVTIEEIIREADHGRSNVRVVAELFREFDRRLQARAAATYGDLIGATTALLRERPEIVERLRVRWRYVLLDESQDTSDLQLRFIDTLFGKPGDENAAGMMPVGDYRQSIYGFNGADEHVMDLLSEVANAKHDLFVNRRSYQEIVDAGHAVLAVADILKPGTRELDAQLGSGTLGCVRVQNFGDKDQSLKERVKLEAAAIALEIRRLLADGVTQMSDIAILVRRRTHAIVYQRALNRQGVSAALDRRSGLFASDEIRDVLAWLALLVDLGNEQAAVRVLQSPVCGLNDAAMIALTTHSSWLEKLIRDELDDSSAAGDTRERLAQVRALLVELLPNASLPLPAAMERIMQTLPIAASYVSAGEREGVPTIGEQAIVNLSSFELLAREFAADKPGARMRDFVEDVDRRILYDDDVQEAELDRDGVRILTIHQAKGLEWPYVFVACSTSNQYSTTEPTDRVVVYVRKTGAFALKHDVEGRETFQWVCLTNEHDPSDGQLLDPPPNKEAAKREQARVFYVALTRAKKRVYVTVPAPLPEKGTGFEAPFLKSVRDWAKGKDPNVDLSFGGADAVAMPAPIAAIGQSNVLPRDLVTRNGTESAFRPLISFTSISSFEMCPRQARYRYRLHLPDLREARPRFAGLDGNETPLSSNAARFGSLVHRALETWNRTPDVTFDEAFESALREFDDVTMSDARRARASGERAVEKLAGYMPLAVEEPFELRVAETTVIGAVDLIARDTNGTVVVIDYKTGHAAGEKYALQLALYGRVAQARYPGETIRSAILRLTPDAATFEDASPMEDTAVDPLVAEVGELTSDVPRVGIWCGTCAYNGSPCFEPLQGG